MAKPWAKPTDKGISTILRVPNTDDGRQFLKQLRAYATAGTAIRSRGRGPRVKAAELAGKWKETYRQSLPHEHAEYFAVYIHKPELEKTQRQQADRLYRQIVALAQNSMPPAVSKSVLETVRLFQLRAKRSIRIA
jgi:hypothetical protein